MKGTVAITSGLSDVSQMLKEEGYEVVTVKNDLDKADVVVVSGMDDDFLGMQDILTPVSVVTASGKSAVEIVDEVRRCIDIK
jgi:hypothetical protein